MSGVPAHAADDGTEPVASPPALSPAAQSKQLREEASGLRSQAETQYHAAESACYKRFFVNGCISDAKAERLAVIRRARELETEAFQIDLAERNRQAAEVVKKAEGHNAGARSTAATSPSADVDIAPRSPEPTAVTAPRRVVRSGSRSNASENSKAARRAQTARRDRERYDARIHELEEKKARDADGR